MVKKIPYYYLFTGYVKLSEDKKSIVPEEHSLDTVRNTVVFTEDPRARDSKMQFLAWKTNKNGVFYVIKPPFGDRSSPVHRIGKKQVFHIPPPEMLMYTWAAQGKEWAKTLSHFFQQEGSKGIELSKHKVNKRHLRPPRKPSSDGPEDQSEVDYRNWYGKLREDEPLYGFILARTRAVFFLFSSDEFEGATLEVWPPKSKSPIKLEIKRRNNIIHAVLQGTPSELPVGIYSIKVSNLKNISSKRWNADAGTKRAYQLKEKIRFNITNLAGEFDMVNCDPISLEEAVMLQFPLQYAHLVTAAKKNDTFPDMKIDQSIPPLPEPLKPWSNRLSWTYDKAKMSVNLINADGNNGRARILGDAIWNTIDPENEVLKGMKKTIDLAFNTKETYTDWAKFKKKLVAEKKLSHVKEVIWKDLKSSWARNKWWNHLKDTYADDVNAKILKVDKLPDAERKALLKAGVPQKETNLQKAIGGAGKVIEKGIVVADTALSYYQVGLAANEVLGTHEKLTENVNSLKDLIKQYDKLSAGVPCREGIANLEKYRAATVTGQLDLDEKSVQAASKALDAVLGTLCLIPVTAKIAGLIILIKGTASLAADAITSLGKWADQAIFGNYFSELLSNLQLLGDLQKAAYANQDLMPDTISEDGGKNDIHVQFRLRAEALYGLIALLTRAGLSSNSPKEYQEKIKKYRVAEYIQTILLRDQWEFPIKPLVPISMDTYWIYALSSFGPYADPISYYSQFGFKSPLTSSTLNPIPGSMLILAITDELLKDRAKANFQQSLPISRIDAKSTEELAKSFKTTFRELNQECIEYTCIYKRRKGSKKDEDWRPINPKGVDDVDDLDELSPFDQIRVLVVLDKKWTEGIYPISLQLYRTDGTNISGPVYKDIVRRLDPFLLKSEKKWKGRLGCVFYPFYQVGNWTIPGTKPLAGSAVGIFGEGAYYLFGGLTHMTYALEVKVGGERSKQWVKIGAGDKRASDLDEYLVSVDTRRDPHEKRLLDRTFLQSRTKESPYPMLFQGAYNKGVGPVYVRFGKSGTYSIPPPADGNLIYNNFNWNTEVEFVVVVWATRVITSNYEKLNLDWKVLPIGIELVNYEGYDEKGPSYRSKLRYLGEFYPGGHSFRWDASKPGNKLQPLVDLLTHSDTERKKFDHALDPLKLGSMRERRSRYYIFAAYFRMHYYTPDGKKVYSVRPFADSMITYPKYYRYAIVNIATPRESGLGEPKIIGGRSGTSRPEYEFHFQAPRLYTRNVPWASTKVTEERIKRWIEKEGKKLKPKDDIVK